MSWHINSKGKSVIQEVINQFNKKESAYIQIFTPNDDFYIFDTDKCIVAKGFIYIQSDIKDNLKIQIINIDKIESICVIDKNVADPKRTSDDNS